MPRAIDDILKDALSNANENIPSEEITYTEMMENLAHARREAKKKRDKPT